MKKHLLYTLIMLFSVVTTMAENTQRIQVLQYIPDKEGGVLSSDIHKRPLPGVTIEISGAAPVHCDRIGCATVHFNRLVVGDHVNVKTITKPGFQLFSLDTQESWFVPQDNHEIRQILMISDEDMSWIEEQWHGVVENETGYSYGFYSPDEHLLCTDMSSITPLQKSVLPLILAGNFEKAIETISKQDLLEKYRSNLNGDPKVLRDIDADLQFVALSSSLHSSSSQEERFSLLNSLFQFKSDIPWLLSYYPDLCHSLRKYEEYEAYLKVMMNNPETPAAIRAYLLFWKAYNTFNNHDVDLTISIQEQALNAFDSIAAATNDPDIYPYNRAIINNVLGSQYLLKQDSQKMDNHFSRARRLFEVSLAQKKVQDYTIFPYYAIQAEGYWKMQYKTEMVDQLLTKAASFSKQITSDSNQNYLSAYLTTLRRFASIQYLRGDYKEAYNMVCTADQAETAYFARQPQLRAEHYAQFLLLKARICIKLGKMAEADDALTRSYAAYEVIDRLNPGDYKQEYLDIHLMHVPVRISLGLNHWARADLTRAEVLAQQVYADNQEMVDSIYWLVQDLRQQLPPRMVSEETARARYNPDRLEFAFITDTHNYGRSADIREADKNIEGFVSYCNEHPAIQCAIHGGDFINAYDTNHESALWCLTRARYQFMGLQIPFYTVKGNHDCNGKQWKNDMPDNSQIVTDKEYFDLFHPFSVLNPLASADVTYNETEPTRNYYFRDYDTQRVRMIFLNAYHRDSLERYGYLGEQLRWFAENALDFSHKEEPDDWGFIVFAHTLPPNLDRGINRLLKAYVEGEPEHRDSTYYVPFTWSAEKQHRAMFIALICGHQHIDIYNNLNGYNQINVTRGFATGNEVQYDPLSFSHFIVDTRNHTLVEQRIGSGHSRTYSYGEKSEQLSPHFPFKGADGLGSYTTGGGQDGRIITVTNLQDDGPGSLRWAVSQNGARYIAFKRGGTINLQSPLVIENDSITILGQTAPKPVVIKGDQIIIKASEVIMRYLTIEPGAKNCNAIQDDHFGQKRLILDHLTIGATLHSGIALRYVEDATVEHCHIHGTLSEDHPTLLAGGFKVTYYNNFIDGGNRAIKIPESIGTNRWNHIVRNIIFNWKEYSIYGAGNQAETSITENYLIPTNRTQQLKVLQVGEDGTSRYYVRRNTIRGFENSRQQDLIIDHSGVPWRMPIDIDTARWNTIPPVARPNPQQYGFASSCITIAAFHYKEIDGNPTPQEIYDKVTTRSGNVMKKRLKKNRDRNGDGIPDQFTSREIWLNALESE